MEYTVEFVAEEILRVLPLRDSYTKASLSELMADAGIDIWDTDFSARYDVRDKIVKVAKKAGYILEFSEFEGTYGGAPFNEPAMIIKPGAVTEADFYWYHGGMQLVEDVACVHTKILQHEIQVRYFDGVMNLIRGFIFSVDTDQRVELFSLLEKCSNAWDQDDYLEEACDGGSWEVRLFSGRKVARKVCGSTIKPPLGDQIEKAVKKLVDKKNLYLF